MNAECEAVKAVQLQQNEEVQKQVRSFLKQNLRCSQKNRFVKKVLNFKTSFIVILKEGDSIKGLAMLFPVFNDYFNGGENDLVPNSKFFSEKLGSPEFKIWELRFYAEGDLFKCLQEIAYSKGLERNYLEEHYDLEVIVDLLNVIRDSSLEIKAIITGYHRTEIEKDSSLLLKALSKTAELQGLKLSCQDLDGYHTLTL